MRNSHDAAPVGVVPRRRARSIEPLMRDTTETCTVSDSVERPGGSKKATALPQPLQWLPFAASAGMIAAALEWLKLTR